MSKIGVLILVHQDILESILILVEHIRKVAQQHIHIVKQVVKIHGVGFAQTTVVLVEDISYLLLAGHTVRRHYIRIIGIILRRKQVRLGHGNAVQHIVGGISLRIQIQLFDHALDERLRIICVVNRHVVGKAQFFSFNTKNAVKDGVKSAHCHGFGNVASDKVHDSTPHLGSSFVGKRQRQNTIGIHSTSQHVSDTIG